MPATAPRLDEWVHRDGIEKYVVEVCLRCRIHRADVEDVVQDVLTEILAGKHSFQPDRGEFDKWMHAVAWNVVRQHARKSKRHGQRFAAYCGNIDEHPTLESSPERCVQRKQMRESITHAAQNLSDRDIDVIVLHVVDELTHVEIGQEIRISSANSQKCFQRTRNHLARCLRDKILVTMPPSLSTCEESISTPKRRSRWESSHYIVQVATLVIAAFSVAPAIHWMQSPPALERELVPRARQNAAMYDNDKPIAVHDEPSVLSDTASVKPEPASLPSVRNVSTPAKLVDKPAVSHSRTSSSSYTFKYKADFSAHRPGNIR